MTAALELLTSQERARAAARRDPQDHDAGQSAKAPTDEPLVTMLMIELDPGASQPPHLHPGPIFSYVLEGELLFQCHGTEKVTYEEGDVFWEPGIDRPRLLAANPSSELRTRFLAICIGVPGEPVTRVIEWPVEG